MEKKKKKKKMSLNEDLTKKYKMFNNFGVWMGYFETRQLNTKLVFRAKEKLRTAKCARCGTPIPPTIPRATFEAAFSYAAGNYCLKCAMTLLKQQEEHLLNVLENIKEKLRTVRQFKKLINQVQRERMYEQYSIVGKLMREVIK